MRIIGGRYYAPRQGPRRQWMMRIIYYAGETFSVRDLFLMHLKLEKLMIQKHNVK